MYPTILPVPKTIALSYDRERNPIDWPQIKAQVMNDHLNLDYLAIVNRVQDLWEHPEKRNHTTKVTVRAAEVLAVGGCDDQALNDRRAIQAFKDLRIHEKAGFDGVLATGTWDSQFAFWLTPGDLISLIEDGEDHDLADFDPEAIEAAARDMVSANDWAYTTFSEMRDEVIEDAKRRTAAHRSRKETVNL